LPSPFQGEGMAGRLPSPFQGEGMAGRLPSPFQGEGMAGRLPSPFQGEGMAGRLPSLFQGEGMAGRLPSLFQGKGMTGPLPSHFQGKGMAGRLPSPFQGEGMAGRLPSLFQGKGMAGPLPSHFQRKGMTGPLPSHFPTAPLSPWHPPVRVHLAVRELAGDCAGARDRSKRRPYGWRGREAEMRLPGSGAWPIQGVGGPAPIADAVVDALRGEGWLATGWGGTSVRQHAHMLTPAGAAMLWPQRGQPRRGVPVKRTSSEMSRPLVRLRTGRVSIPGWPSGRGVSLAQQSAHFVAAARAHPPQAGHFRNWASSMGSCVMPKPLPGGPLIAGARRQPVAQW